MADRAALEAFREAPTRTADHHEVLLCCNIGSDQDVKAVLESGGEGIGLFRTEFLFMDRTTAPDEQEQFEAYRKALMVMKGKTVVIRTLDIGGDKDIPYMNLVKEENPFLGFRAVRYCLKNPEMYKIQLRALLRAGVYGDLQIMVPLVTGVDELRAVKALIKEAEKELESKKIDYKKDIKVGVMIETPAAAMTADLFAKEADFFSIGTNDLTGYTMAADRGNPNVEYLYSVFNPAVLRSLKYIISVMPDCIIAFVHSLHGNRVVYILEPARPMPL